MRGAFADGTDAPVPQRVEVSVTSGRIDHHVCQNDLLLQLRRMRCIVDVRSRFRRRRRRRRRRIDTFLDPSQDPLGAGYHITQAKIALGSGGWTGRGFMEGTQSRLNFLPEKHTDFIFTTLAEEFGFVGAFSLLGLYTLLIGFCVVSALANKDRFSSLLILGIAATFFFFFAVNMAMVMGLAPVVGVPLPLVSYGGSAMLVLLCAFGLMQSAHVHRPR